MISMLHNVISWCKMYIWCAILQKKARENRHVLAVLKVLETLLAVGKLFLIMNCTKILVQFLSVINVQVLCHVVNGISF